MRTIGWRGAIFEDNANTNFSRWPINLKFKVRERELNDRCTQACKGNLYAILQKHITLAHTRYLF